MGNIIGAIIGTCLAVLASIAVLAVVGWLAIIALAIAVSL